MKCPACGAANVFNAERCKCGYVFQGPQTESVACLASIERSVRTIKRLLIWWFVLTLIGGALWVLAHLLRS